MLLRSLLNRASPAGPQGRLSTLILHRVLRRPDPLFPGEIDAAVFDAMCGWLRSWFHVLPLDEAVRRWEQKDLPARALAITFDDGYADNHDVALPILQRHGLCATFFVATGFLDGGRMWNDTVIEAVRLAPGSVLDLRGAGSPDLGELSLATPESRRRAIDTILAAIKYLPPDRRAAVVQAIADRSAAQLPDDLMMSSAQVVALRRAGMAIGAHTVTHPILASLADEQARDEIRQSRQTLEQLLGERVGLFAYPNGKPGRDYEPRHALMARELGFDAAVSTAWGATGAESRRYELPRFTPWDRSRWRFGFRMLRNLQQGTH